MTQETAPPGAAAMTAVEEEILRAVRRIRYGSVEITIHDSRVVQIQQTEKVRVDALVPSGRPEGPRRSSSHRQAGGPSGPPEEPHPGGSR